ncbi:MAG: ribosome biogenesis GTPase Der [Lachnospiraceae bacterium]|nr:ribosome biogenesis GTPase Der [Lachnospiraceae bacterium]
MSKAIVAVVGRPNVGKSTLFNALAGSRISIVQDTPGVTRDRIYADCSWLNYSFTLVDTGGIEPDSSDVILRQMREQAEIAVETADVIIFMTDVQAGLTESDMRVADILRRSKKPVVLCVNKVDSFAKYQNDVYEFYQLGLGDPVPVSAGQLLGLGDLLDAVTAHFPPQTEEAAEDERPRIAIVGRPNAGKSSIVNRMAGQNRVIVSDIPGTTRDAIDTAVRFNKKEYVLIDTAGLRRKSKIKEEIERFSIIRAVSAIERADVVLLVIDAAEGISEHDAKIAGIAHERDKGLLVVVNKWDLVEKDDKTMAEHKRRVREVLSFVPYADILFVSALSGQRLARIFENVDAIVENRSLRISTGVLNEILSQATAMKQPPSDKGRVLRLYYATQVGIKPPTFVFFINDKKLMHFSYLRYLENQIRETFGFYGTSIKIILRERNEKEQ